MRASQSVKGEAPAMRSPIMLLPFLCLILLPMNAAAQTQQRQELLSTEEWVDLYNKDEKISVSYLKGVLDTLGAIGNFTCTKPLVLADSAARIRVEWVEQPEKMHTWFIFALMADLTKNYHCRFTDTDKLTYSNGKLREWETTK
jgi:hypothetical protein